MMQLESLSKEEIIRKYRELEKEKEALEKELRKYKNPHTPPSMVRFKQAPLQAPNIPQMALDFTKSPRLQGRRYGSSTSPTGLVELSRSSAIQFEKCS